MGKKKVQVLEEEGSAQQQPQQDEESYSERPKSKKKNVKKETKAGNTKKTQPKKAETKKVNPQKKEKVKAGQNQQKQNKKKDFLPGQKYPTPDEEDGALAFYKSLYEKNPHSEMARKYCLEYGVLEPQEAARLLKEMVKSKK